MQHKLLKQQAVRKNRKYNWKSVVATAVAAVLIITNCAPLQSAIAMGTEEKKVFCGLVEHEHTQDCFDPTVDEAVRGTLCSLENLGVHEHEEGCYDESGNVICGLADYVLHTHTEICYDSDGELRCTLTERQGHVHTEECYEAAESDSNEDEEKEDAESRESEESQAAESSQSEETHVHTDACYEEGPGELICEMEENHHHGEECYVVSGEKLICGKAETEGHTHTEGCFKDKLICGLEETEGHIHDDACYVSDQILECTLEEKAGHAHEDNCYTTEKSLTCALEENEEHSHDDGCYTEEQKLTCTLEASEGHTHSEGCYRTEQRLICEEKEAEAHSHTEECYVKETEPSCGLEESEGHTHDKSCYEENRELICELEEDHVHSDSCYAKKLICEDTNQEESGEESDAADESKESESSGEEGSEEEIKESESAPEPDQERKLVCELAEEAAHEHGENCYDGEILICGQLAAAEHVHTEDCFKPLGILCGLEEHKHTAECYLGRELTAEEQEQIKEVIDLIDALPTSEEIEAKIAEYEDAEDEDGLTEYLTQVKKQAVKAWKAYDKLGEILQLNVTNAEKLMDLEWLWSAADLGENVGDFPAMTSDEAYVSALTIAGWSTGTSPWDEDNEPGNDKDENNNIVRTFDTVTYNFNVTMEAYDSQHFSEARVKLEFVLPLTKDQAEFDTGAMGWMDTASGYKWSVTTENRTIDEKTVSCQVLTCYKHLLPAENNKIVVPGEFGENVTIKIKGMKNGDTLSPVFSAAMEYGTWDGECSEHNRTEKKSITPDRVTVSAAPKYNVKLTKGNNVQVKMNFDFDGTGNELALNKAAKDVEGRSTSYGITLQLYNDSAEKKLKGIEYPQGDITFDIKLTSKFTPNSGSTKGTQTDVTQDYTPLVWSFDAHKSGSTQQDGRNVAMTTYTDAFGSKTPHNKLGNPDSSCYNGGTWKATQEGNVIHVTVSGYLFNGEFPCVGSSESTSEATFYNKEAGIRNIGCFSAGELHLVQPFSNSKTGKSVLDDFSKDGAYEQFDSADDGSFEMKAEVVNLRATSVSNQSLKIVEDNSNQGCTTDDKPTTTINIKRPGGYQNRLLYSNPGSCSMTDVRGIGEGTAGTMAMNGDDWAVLGQKIRLTLGGYAITGGDDGNKMCAAKWLLKFEPEAIELEEQTAANDMSKNNYSYTFAYAVKPDGSGWTNDEELLRTNMFALKYYRTITEAKQHGEIVGILVEAEPKTTVEALPFGNITTYFSQNAKVKADASLAGRTFIITEESRIWTVNDYNATIEKYHEIPSMLENDPTNRELENKLEACRTHRVNSPSTYQPKVYNTDGTTQKEHTGSYTLGDTLLVLDYKARINKYLEQKDSEENTKTTFNLDADQRFVDFTLEPILKYAEGYKPDELNQKTTVKIVDILPKHLTYVPGSCYFGGTYQQTSVNGGTKGTITDGKKVEPNSVEKNQTTGETTLTWIIENATVGGTVDLIHYSVEIGDKGNEANDVKIGTTNFTNKVEITTTEDFRTPTAKDGNYAEVGLVATRGRASAYGKYVKQSLVEPDGEIDYTIYYDNNSQAQIPQIVLLDTMPQNNDGNTSGSSFNATYKITSWKLNVSKYCGSGQSAANRVPGNLKLYYTTDAKYKGLVMQENSQGTTNHTGVITRSEISSWTKVEIASDGTASGIVGQMPTAWAVLGPLDNGRSINIDMTIKLTPNADTSFTAETAKYVNILSNEDFTTSTLVQSVRRTLEGIAWLDTNADGQQNDGNTGINGIKVILYKDNKKVCEVETGKQISILGGEAVVYENGRYRFTDLLPGTYKVQFEGGSTGINDYFASTANKTGVADEVDSDGIPSYAQDGKVLEKTIISGINMKTAQELGVTVYESKYNDSGFYPAVYDLTVSKQVTGNMGDRNKEFTFEILLKESKEQDAKPLTETYSYTRENSVSGASEKGDLTADSNGKITFQLKHGDALTLKGLPKHCTYEVSETNDSVKGYRCSWSGNRKCDDLQSDKAIVCTNHAESTPPTGIIVDVLPYVLIALLVLLAGGAWIFFSVKKKRRRKQSDDEK